MSTDHRKTCPPSDLTHTTTVIAQDDRVVQCQLAQINRNLRRQPPLLRQLGQCARLGDPLRELLQLTRLRIECLQVLLEHAGLKRLEKRLWVAQRAPSASSATGAGLLAILLLLTGRRARGRGVSAAVTLGLAVPAGAWFQEGTKEGRGISGGQSG